MGILLFVFVGFFLGFLCARPNVFVCWGVFLRFLRTVFCLVYSCVYFHVSR